MGIPSNKRHFTLVLRTNIIVFIFNGLTYYIYCSTLISTIILRVQIVLLFTLTVIIILNIIFIITITIFFYLLISFKIYLFIHLFIYWYVDLFSQKGVFLVGFLTLGCSELKEQVSTQTYIYNSSLQPSRECLVINWMLNSHYGPYHL